MTRRERMLAALRQRQVDRLPFCTYNLHPYGRSEHAQDPSYRELLALVEAKAGIYCKCSVRTVRPKDDPRAALRTTQVVDDGEQRVATTILHTPKGDLRSVVVTPRNQPSMEIEHFIKTDTDIERYLSLPWDPPEYDIASLVALEQELGDRGIIAVAYSDPMYATAALFDFEDFCVRCLTQRDSLRRLMDHLSEQIAEETRRKVAACRGHDLVFLTSGPEVATPPMLPPALFRELVVPYQKRLTEIIHEAGFLVMVHCHGRVRQVLDYIIEMGADALEPIEPPPQGDIGLAELLKRTRGRLALMGHVQDQEFHTAAPGTMTRRVEEIARIARGATGYIMSPTCTPFQHPASPTFLRNYTEWLEAAARIL